MIQADLSIPGMLVTYNALEAIWPRILLPGQLNGMDSTLVWLKAALPAISAQGLEQVLNDDISCINAGHHCNAL